MADRPNPVVHHAEASSLPRSARGRVGQLTDPLPEGKKLDVEPKHHFDVEPAKHDPDRAKAFDPSELPPEHQEAMKKMQDDAYRQQKNRLLSSAQEGMYWGGTQTGANKLMDSRRPHGGMLQSDAPVSRKHH